MPYILVLLLAVLCCCAERVNAEPAPERLAVLRHGVNITNWFRFPVNQDPRAMRAYLGDPALQDLRRAGFSFVRLPVQPEVLARHGMLAVLTDAIGRLQRHGLGVVLSLHPVDWHLETSSGDRARLRATWRSLAPVLRPFDPRLTFAEVVNEPVFPGDPQGWARLQRTVLAEIRASLPANTIVLTGNDWGSIDGLLATVPEPDPDVVYSFHLYEPAELTTLAAYRPGLDTAALGRLPFPVGDTSVCEAIAARTDDPSTADLMRFYCAQHWDSAKLAARIDAAADWARRNHVALLAGEFGASRRLNAAARLAWLSTAREACERRSIGWALWGYDDSMGFAQHPPAGASALDPEVLKALGLSAAMVHQ
jgi:endoglucanase